MSSDNNILFLKDFFPNSDQNLVDSIQESMGDENYQHIKNFVEQQYFILNNSLISGKPILLSELFYFLLSLRLLNIQITKNFQKNVYEYLNNLKTPNGGFYGSKPTKDWHIKTGSTIDSIFYGINSLLLLEKTDDFFNNDVTWCILTKNWLKSCQHSNGCFTIPISPFSIKIENATWANWIFKYMSQNKIFDCNTKEINLIRQTTIKWTVNEFLSDSKHWSVTRLLYANILLDFGNSKLSQEKISELLHFLQNRQDENFFNEFDPDVKKGYRVDSNEAEKEVLLHSSIFGNILLSRMNNQKIPDALISELCKKFRQNSGFGSQIRIKTMNYGSNSTLFENSLIMILALITK